MTKGRQKHNRLWKNLYGWRKVRGGRYGKFGRGNRVFENMTRAFIPGKIMQLREENLGKSG